MLWIVAVLGLLLAVTGAGAAGSPLAGASANVTGAGMSHGEITLAQVQAAAPDTVASIRTLDVDGVERGYLVVAPAHPAGPLPVILVLHGINASATQEFLRDEFAPVATGGRAILVYPAGYEESWDADPFQCCGTAGALGVADIAFIAAVVHDVTAHYSVAAGRTYLVGFSNGGKLAYSVMCAEPQLFDAFAAVAAAPLTACSSSDQSPVPMMVTIGGSDPEVDVLGSSGDPPATVLSTTAGVWRTRDRCTSAPVTGQIGTASITTYTGCAAGSEVRTVLYPGLIHLWPGAAEVGGLESGATLIWSFFSSLSDSAALTSASASG